MSSRAITNTIGIIAIAITVFILVGGTQKFGAFNNQSTTSNGLASAFNAYPTSTVLASKICTNSGIFMTAATTTLNLDTSSNIVSACLNSYGSQRDFTIVNTSATSTTLAAGDASTTLRYGSSTTAIGASKTAILHFINSTSTNNKTIEVDVSIYQ